MVDRNPCMYPISRTESVTPKLNVAKKIKTNKKEENSNELPIPLLVIVVYLK
jgi:hypothetical protein